MSEAVGLKVIICMEMRCVIANTTQCRTSQNRPLVVAHKLTQYIVDGVLDAGDSRPYSCFFYLWNETKTHYNNDVTCSMCVDIVPNWF